MFSASSSAGFLRAYDEASIPQFREIWYTENYDRDRRRGKPSYRKPSGEGATDADNSSRMVRHRAPGCGARAEHGYGWRYPGEGTALHERDRECDRSHDRPTHAEDWSRG